MLPDFPNIKRDLKGAGNEFLRKYLNTAEPMLGIFRTQRQHEGDHKTYTREDGTQETTNYPRVQAELVLAKGELATLSVADTFERFRLLAEDMARQMAGRVFSTLETATEAAGTRVDAGGRPLTFDLYLEMLDKLQIDFDPETGQPIWPTLVTSPEAGKKLGEQLPEWLTDDDNRARLGELVERKREDWNARESDRRLVD